MTNSRIALTGYRQMQVELKRRFSRSLEATTKHAAMDDSAQTAFTGKTARNGQLAAYLKRDQWPKVATVLDRAAMQIVSRVGSPLALLLTLSLVQGLLWLWATFGIVEQQIAPAHALTLLGSALYRPDRDLPIYLAGTLCCVLLDALLVTLLMRSSIGACSQTGLRVEGVACAVVVLLPFIASDSKPGYLAACVAGLGLFAWRLQVRWRSPRARPSARVPPIPTHPAGLRRRQTLFADCGLPLAILGVLVFVPWPQALLWDAYAGDRFHHFDFYVMAPALAYAHGLRLATDFYSQYGVGWPMVMAALERVTGAAGYTAFIRMEVLVGCVYFMALFVFLRSWLRNAGWATFGLLLALALALFIDTGDGPKWLWPSSTVMRHAFDIALFAALLLHTRSGDARLGPVAGALLALQLLFSLDVACYLLLAFCVYLVCAIRASSEWPSGSVPRFALGATLSLTLVAGVGFTLANQGELPGRAFWYGLTESIFVYGDGIGNLPVAQTIGGFGSFALLLLAMLAVYFRHMGSAVSACFARSVSPRQAIRAAIATYGLGALLQFIGRSHDQNLMHVTVPFCLLVADLAVSMGRAWVTSAVPRRIRPLHVLSLALVAVICVQAADVGYPNILDVAIGAARTTGPGPTWASRAGDAIPFGSLGAGAAFREASDAIRRASDGGRNKVAVVAYDDTAYLKQAGVAPYFRYSPVLASLLLKDQVQSVTRRIAEAPPDWIFIVEPARMLWGASSADAIDAILVAMNQDYVKQGRAGHFTMYRRAASGNLPGAAPRP